MIPWLEHYIFRGGDVGNEFTFMVTLAVVPTGTLAREESGQEVTAHGCTEGATLIHLDRGNSKQLYPDSLTVHELKIDN